MSSVSLDGVKKANGTSNGHAPYTRVASKHGVHRSVVRVGSVPFGPGSVTMIAGPCAVETPEQTLEAAFMAKRAGAAVLRGGAFKPRTSPYAFQGLGERALRILADVRDEVHLPIVTEVIDAHQVDLVAATRTCCRSAPGTCRTSSCCKRWASPARRSCSSAV